MNERHSGMKAIYPWAKAISVCASTCTCLLFGTASMDRINFGVEGNWSEICLSNCREELSPTSVTGTNVSMWSSLRVYVGAFLMSHVDLRHGPRSTTQLRFLVLWLMLKTLEARMSMAYALLPVPPKLPCVAQGKLGFVYVWETIHDQGNECIVNIVEDHGTACN